MLGSINIVADENIPFVREAFEGLGRVRLIAGRSMTSASVKGADVLLVRSVTRVNEQLLAGSNVKMVATATIGTDHIDENYLAQSGIRFASAAGSNANSVAEYVVAALLTLAERNGFELAGKTIGVIGVGNVGSKVVDKCRALRMNVLTNDPPMKEATGSSEYIELNDLLSASDIVTLHVPLTMTGKWPTHQMVNEKFLKQLRAGAVLLNTSRGPVVLGSALGRELWSGRLAAVLDVWENEPAIDVELLSRVSLGTPHIAGYSFDGKVNGTAMIYRAACEFLGVEPAWNPRVIMPAPSVPLIHVDQQIGERQASIREIIKRVYDIETDDRNLRELIVLEPEHRSKYFDHLRKTYPVRREFYNTVIEFGDLPAQDMDKILAGLGFGVQLADPSLKRALGGNP
jgi:erythronate-4-phosphate dehydrogenase